MTVRFFDKSKFFRILFVIMVAAVWMPSVFAQKKRAAKKLSAVKETVVDYERQRRFNEFFLESVVQKQKGNYSASFDLLRHALEINPEAPEALSAMGQMLEAAGSEDSLNDGGKYIKKAVELEPDNYYFQQQLAEYYDSHGMNDDAVKRYEIMSRRFPEHDELLYNLAEIYRSQKNWDALVSTLSRLEVQEGKSDEITLRKINAYSSAGKSDSSLVLVNSLIASDPSNNTYRVIRGGVYGDMKDYVKEMAEYEAVLAEDPENEMANLAIMNRQLAQNDVRAYLQTANSIALNEKMSVKTRTGALNSMIMSGVRGTVDSTAALSTCRKIFAKADSDPMLIDIYQGYLTILKASEDSLAPVWRRLLAARPEYSQVRLKLLQYCVKKGLQSDIAKLCEDGVQYEPENIIYYFYGGLAQFTQGQVKRSAETLKKCTELIDSNTNTDLASDVYAMLGDVFHELHEDSLCFQAYDSSLVYKEDNINALNNYAYFLSLKRRDLDKAAAMSLKTVKAQPKNATYIDTYAWVLFELGRYAEAETFINEALKNLDTEKGNASIYEHAGDIYYMRKKSAEALKMWRKAKGLGGDSKTLDRKIKTGKYIAN